MESILGQCVRLALLVQQENKQTFKETPRMLQHLRCLTLWSKANFVFSRWKGEAVGLRRVCRRIHLYTLRYCVIVPGLVRTFFAPFAQRGSPVHVAINWRSRALQMRTRGRNKNKFLSVCFPQIEPCQVWVSLLAMYCLRYAPAIR